MATEYPRPPRKQMPQKRVPEKFLRRRRIFALIVALLVVAIVVTVILVRKPKDSKDPALNDGASQSEQEPSDKTSGDKADNKSSKDDPANPVNQPSEQPDDTEDNAQDGTEDNTENNAEEEEQGRPVAMFRQVSADMPDSSPNPIPKSSSAKVNEQEQEEDWRLLVVSKAKPLTSDFTLKTTEVSGIPVDERVEEPLVRMILAAKADGINLELVSGYRSVDQQQQVYDNKMQEYAQMNLSTEKATEYTEMYIAVPGESEHHSGLAVDLMTPTYSTMNAGYANTPAAKWLKENAADFGFILRYPEGKEKITGFSFEPWHYRYVSSPIAQEIMTKEITLEEYIYMKHKAEEPEPKEKENTGEGDVSPNSPVE